MRSLKTITSELKEVSEQKKIIENSFYESKRNITDPYGLRQFFYGMLIAFPLAFWFSWLLWMERNYSSFQLEIENVSTLSVIIIYVCYIFIIFMGVLILFEAVNIFLEVNLFAWLSYFFFSKTTHQRINKIEANDFSNEPELAQIFAELEEKKLTYEALQNEYEIAEQEIQQRSQAFINSCQDKEVKEFLFEKTKKEE